MFPSEAGTLLAEIVVISQARTEALYLDDYTQLNSMIMYLSALYRTLCLAVKLRFFLRCQNTV